MEQKSLVEPFCSAFVFVDTATYSGPLSPIPKAADAHRVGKKLLSDDNPNIVAAHPVLGPTDLLLVVTANTPGQLLNVLHEQIRSYSQERHDFVKGTRTQIITSWFGSPPERATFADKTKTCAWVLGTVGVPDPAQFIAEWLLKPAPTKKSSSIKIVAPVLGEYDVFLFLAADSVAELQDELDGKVRNLRHFTSTDTRLVLWTK